MMDRGSIPLSSTINMKITHKTPRKRMNNSSSFLSKKLLQALQTVMSNMGGRINYVFLETRIEFTDKHPLGVYVQRKSYLNAPIGPQMFFKDTKNGVQKRTVEEVYQIFRSTSDDLGASYFLIS